MNKKLIILVIFSFFLSTAGLPISLRYCNMEEITSFSDCGMCSVDIVENKDSCCDEVDDYSVQFNSKLSEECCVTKLIESSVKDEFVLELNKVKIDFNNFNSVIINNVFNFSPKVDQYKFTFSDSSPPLNNNNLYLLNSLFLI